MSQITHSTQVAVVIVGPADDAWRTTLHAKLANKAPVFAGSERLGQAIGEAARQYPQHDLIVLKADCLLAPAWFERVCHALQHDHVAMLQPLTPACLPGVDWPASAEALAAIDQRCFAYASREAVDCATLNAPLLALRAAALPYLLHDDQLNLAALPAPWRALRMETMLVADAEPSSTEPTTTARTLAQDIAQSVLDDAKPIGYPGLDTKPVLLHIGHGWGGGAARWIEDFAAADDTHHHLLLEAHGSFPRRHHGECFRLRFAGRKLPPLREFTPPLAIASTALTHPAYAEFLREVIADYGVNAIVVSSLIGHSLDALRSALPTVAIIHDHYPLWPLLHRNFGDPELAFDAEQRHADLAAAGKDFEFAERDAGYWQALRDAYARALLDAHATLVAPSHSAMAAQLRLAPELRDLPQQIIAHGMAAWPAHPLLPAAPPRTRLRLLVPGRVRSGKGAQLLHAALPQLREYADIVLLGAGAEGMEFFGQRGVNVILQYDRDDLPRLIASLAPDAALLLSTVSETFSYALSEMHSLGVPVIATRIGALAERIQDGVNGILIEPSAAALVAAVRALSLAPQGLSSMRQTLTNAPTLTRETMADTYGPLLALPTQQGARYRCAIADVARLDARAEQDRHLDLQATLQAQASVTTQQQALVAERTRWAMTLESKTRTLQGKLQQRNADANALEAELVVRTHWAKAIEADLDARTTWAQSMDAELNDLRPLAEQRGAQIEQLLHSRSWRVTAPMRYATNFARRVRASAKFRLTRLRSLRGRLRGSLGRRGVVGTLARIRDEFAHTQTTIKPIASPPPDTAFTPFAMATSATPHVSIVIPIHNKIEYTVACLRSLTEHASGGPDFEVIVVDDASSDASAEHLAQIDGIRVLCNAENL
ncbi:MAG: glycosyltransferase, partial [Xanthomonadales bacterium]|nr:glycosyltransferase [Xanthomonadales bacterium]